MKCPNCGKELSDSAKFCTGCGHQISVQMQTQDINFQNSPQNLQNTSFINEEVQQTFSETAASAQSVPYSENVSYQNAQNQQHFQNPQYTQNMQYSQNQQYAQNMQYSQNQQYSQNNFQGNTAASGFDFSKILNLLKMLKNPVNFVLKGSESDLVTSSLLILCSGIVYQLALIILSDSKLDFKSFLISLAAFYGVAFGSAGVLKIVSSSLCKKNINYMRFYGIASAGIFLLDAAIIFILIGSKISPIIAIFIFCFTAFMRYMLIFYANRAVVNPVKSWHSVAAAQLFFAAEILILYAIFNVIK